MNLFDLMGAKPAYYKAPPVGRDHPETSHKAADTIALVTGKIRQEVYAYALSCGSVGFIDEQLFQRWPDAPESSLRTRRAELTQAGRLRATEARRPNRRGRDCVVWVATEGQR